MKEKQLLKNGKRQDGRGKKELRDIEIEAGFLKRADGSAYMEWGGNKVLGSVYGPRKCYPKHERNPYKARLNYNYRMATFSVDERTSPKPSRRSTEISKVSSEALEDALFLEYYPNTTIDIYVVIMEAEAGTRCAALSTASVALADAGIPMKDLVPSCASGKIDGEIVLDLAKEEDQDGEADLPVAYLPHSDKVSLMQMDGDLTPEEYEEALDLAVDGCMRVYEKQKEALKGKYKYIKEGEKNGDK